MSNTEHNDSAPKEPDTQSVCTHEINTSIQVLINNIVMSTNKLTEVVERCASLDENTTLSLVESRGDDMALKSYDLSLDEQERALYKYIYDTLCNIRNSANPTPRYVFSVKNNKVESNT